MSAAKKQIEILPYDPKWPEIFEIEAKKIRQALGSSCLQIHHIGSTSVPGLMAKRDIDIVCVVDHLQKSLHLQEIGYLFKGELNIPLRTFFSKNRDFSKVNLHVCETNHSFLKLNLLFRDLLRENSEKRDAYAALKQAIIRDAQMHDQIEALPIPKYTLAKDAFVQDLLEKAGFDEPRVNFCMHKREWEEYHRIRNEEIFSPEGVIYDPKHPTLFDPHHYHLVLYKGTKILGAAHVEFLPGNEAALRPFAIEKGEQNKGHGRFFLEFLETWLRFHGKKILHLHARPDALAFYEKLGFSPMPFIGSEPLTPGAIDYGKIL